MINTKEEFNTILERLKDLNYNGKLGKHLQAKLEAFEELEVFINLTIPVVVRQSEQLKEGHKNSFKYWLEENNYKKVYDKYVKWGFEYSESELIAKYNEEVMNL